MSTNNISTNNRTIDKTPQNRNILRTDFSFELPDTLIARYPTPQRTASRLLQLDKKMGTVIDGQFTDLIDLINANDLLIFNNTRVIPARLYGYKETGGKLELLVERILSPSRFLAHVRSSKSPKPGTNISFTKDERAPREDIFAQAKLVSRQETLFEIELNDNLELLPLLEEIGHMPLPPYIDRPDETIDKERYQTVYNKHPGAVAAPTAGLHFDDSLLNQLEQKGVQFAFVTLHVGAGTFQPVRADNILDHKMHSEYFEVTQKTIDAINSCKKRDGRIIAVGTTSVRSLESIAQHAKQNKGSLSPFSGDTEIFIYPGYQFQLVDALITNFHLPESTLLMLISALATRDSVLNAYKHAVDQKYRFFSYGDSMFIS